MIRENVTRENMTRQELSRARMTRPRLTRVARAVVVSVVSLAMVTVVSGCGATNALLGIHQAPKAKATSVPLTVEQAKKVLSRTFTAAYLGETSPDAAVSATQLRTAYTNEGLRGVKGRIKLASVQPGVTSSALQAPHPKLLAVSRGFGFPRFILAQTVASEGLPTLHLLTSPDVATPYRISMSVEMVPPATVKPFDSLGKGSPLLANDVTTAAGLAVAPATLLNIYAEHMRYPKKPLPKPPFAPDSFSAQLQAGASGVAKAVAVQAGFAQAHTVVPSSVHAVRQANGDGLVFGVIERTDSFAVRRGQSVNTTGSKAFVLLTGKKQVTDSASITTLEFVVFAVPRSTGQATLVGAREQIVDGSGS